VSPLPPAVSLTHTFTEVGALVALAGLLGIALLSLLLFSQGREIKRLREWAGRAPERAAELDQRLAGATAPVSPQVPVRTATTGVPAMSSQVSGVRPIPRAVPLVARTPGDASEQVGPSVAAIESAGMATAGVAAATAAPATSVAAGAPVATISDVPAGATAATGADAAAAMAVAAVPAATAAGVAARGHQDATPPGQANAGEPAPVTAAGSQPEISSAAPLDQLPAPATTAASGRVAEPAPAAVPGGSPVQAPLGTPPVQAPSLTPATPPAVAVTAGSKGSVATAAIASAGGRSSHRYPPAPTPGGDGGGGLHQAQAVKTERAGDHQLPHPSEFKFLKEEPPKRGPGRWPLVGGVVVVVIIVLVVVIATGGGHSSGTGKSSASNSSGSSAAKATNARNAGAAANAVSAAHLHVDVLNSTEVTGLAHRLATTLRERGFAAAQALQGRPAGTYTTSVVEYSAGETGAAERVARALGIEAGAIRPLESSTQELAEGAAVVVIAAQAEGATGSGSAESSSGAETAAGGETGGAAGGGAGTQAEGGAEGDSGAAGQ
jgi:hypothetical protein